MAQEPSKTEWTNQTKAINALNRSVDSLVKEIAELNRQNKADAIYRRRMNESEIIETVLRPEKEN